MLPATTQRYTYSHSLSLHDALPVCLAAPEFGPRRLYANLGRAAGQDGEDGYALIWHPAILPCGAAERSEEHTSELQALMRISYAVFCLKEKKITTIITIHHAY